jgi:hypothetical protein
LIDLERDCWRCCVREATTTFGSRPVCEECAAVLEREALPYRGGPMGLASSLWHVDPRKYCWKCMVTKVDPDDDLGLCRSCIRDLVE